MMFKGLGLAWVSLSRFEQYPLDHSFCFLYFYFVLCIYFDVSNKAYKNEKQNVLSYYPAQSCGFGISPDCSQLGRNQLSGDVPRDFAG